MCVCIWIAIYVILSFFVGVYHAVQYDCGVKSVPPIKDVDSIGMIVLYFFSIPTKIIINSFKLVKLVLTCKFR